MITIATIVEGHGEVKALPILIRRILHEAGVYPQVPEPHRLARSKVTSSELARAALLASYRVTDGGIRCLRTSYKEVLHQPRLTSVMDLDEAGQCRWFAKLRRDLLRLAGVAQ